MANLITLALALTALVSPAVAGGDYLLGAGIGDVTGPAAEINMMGYAKMDQNTAGVHLRQFSRAFIFAARGQPERRAVFVSVDAGMISVNVKNGVMELLNQSYGSLYTAENVMITGTHTHSGVAGFHQYVLYLVTSLGYVKETYDNLVNGIFRSIQLAHTSMRPGSISLHQGELNASNINRSPISYLSDPAEERARYTSDTDRDMVLLKMLQDDGKPIGMLNWFAVHAVSMNNTNKLISADNKGVAQLLFESEMNPESFVGQGKVVAAFANSNLGDVSPNTDGPRCSDTGLRCDVLTSTCPNEEAQCFASGPGKNMEDSTKIIGENQFNKAKELWLEKSLHLLKGPVDAVHQYVDMSDETVALNDTYSVKTCKPAMGYSFAAGTTDGPGAFSFSQGDKTGNIFWDTIRDLIKEPSEEIKKCQLPKPILLPTGEIDFPYQWQPSILELQVFRVGQLAIVGVPGEFTTMSGRRLREAVKKVLLQNGFPSGTQVVLAGLANDYSSYITTFEEYQVQRYEAASTIFGPHTLRAYIQRFEKLADSLAKGKKVDPGTPPPDLRDKQISFVPPVVMDTPPLGSHFGDVIDDVKPSYTQGETVTVSFVTGHPRNDPQLEGTYLQVERSDKSQWVTVARDSNWETKYNWIRTNEELGHSKAVITWDIPANQQPGTYRIRHFGHYKVPIIGIIEPLEGISSEFKVTSKDKAIRFKSSVNQKSNQLHPRDI